ncbi:MAG: beta-phosphoglucomutase [Phormidesmis priestleyi Ana]|uniref:Beta-phosphoglucomutase n=1 Tax=Phormidesmis priestleyi Ana TaxID=1666911 RepID=A0A0P7ZK40_9CYAN|nr:MAG: beta-phosphoglucomutase [Phormidesmis priestleyi Ana]
MALKAALFGFSGIIIDDEAIRQTLSEQVLLDENLRPNPDDYRDVCLGRSDRACLKALLTQRGRNVTDETLDKLLAKESATYQNWLDQQETLPLYPGLEDLIFRCRSAQLKMAIVTGAERSQVTSVLQRAELSEHFPIVITGNDLSATESKPAPNGYLKAIEKLNATHPNLQLQANECIAIEDSFAGIEAAKNAQVLVVGVAHTYPNHMLQRRSTWVVDYLREIKLEWIGEKFGGFKAGEENEVDTETPVIDSPPNEETELEA